MRSGKSCGKDQPTRSTINLPKANNSRHASLPMPVTSMAPDGQLSVVTRRSHAPSGSTKQRLGASTQERVVHPVIFIFGLVRKAQQWVFAPSAAHPVRLTKWRGSTRSHFGFASAETNPLQFVNRFFGHHHCANAENDLAARLRRN